MKNVAKQVIRVGEPLVYRGAIEDIPPQLEKPLATFLQESRSRMALFLPLYPRDEFPHKEEKDPNTPIRKKRHKPIGRFREGAQIKCPPAILDIIEG